MHSACGQLCGKGLHGSKEELRSLQNRQLVVKSMVSEKVDTCDGSKVTEYHFRCCALLGNEDTSWEVKREEKDFLKLHLHLKKKGCVSADFPSKSFLSAFGSGMLMRRREDALRDYLNAVLSHCNDEQCVLLCKFLRVNKHFQLCRPSSQGHDVSPAVLTRNLESFHKESTESADDYRKQGRVTLASVPCSSLYCKSLGDSSQNNQGSDELLVVPYSSSDDDDSQYEKVRSSRRALCSRKVAEMNDSVVECVFCCDDEADPKTKPLFKSSAPPARLSKADLLHQQKALLADLKLRQSVRSGCDTRLGGISETRDATLPDEVPTKVLGDIQSTGVAGIGLVFVLNSDGQQKGSVIVDDIMEGSPAEADGTVMVGDKLVSVDGVCIAAKDLTQIRRMIVGNVGTFVTLHFERGGPWQQSSRSFSVCIRRGKGTERGENGSQTLSLVTSSAQTIAPTLENLHLPELTCPTATVTAVFSFCAARVHELNLEPGDQIKVLRKHSSGWWEGRAIHTGSTGWFPSNHVRGTAVSASGSNSPLSEPDSVRSKDSSGESSSSTKSLSLRSTVHASLSANSCDSGASRSPKGNGSNVEEVCSWLKTVDLKDAVDSKRGSRGLGTSYAAGSLAIR